MEENIILNLFGEKDMNVYMFNKIGLALIIILFMALLGYFYL